MALYRCMSGGGTSETTLWTNPRPATAITSDTTVAVADMSNYEQIKVYYRESTTKDAEHSITVEQIDFKESKGNSTSFVFIMCLYAGSQYQARRIWYVSDTALTITQVRAVNSSSGANNSVLIPTKITGLK